MLQMEVVDNLLTLATTANQPPKQENKSVDEIIKSKFQTVRGNEL